MASNAVRTYDDSMREVDPEIVALGAPAELTAHSFEELKERLLEGLASPIAEQPWPAFLADLRAEIEERSGV